MSDSSRRRIPDLLWRPRQALRTIGEEDLSKGLAVVAASAILLGASTWLYFPKLPLAQLAPQAPNINLEEVGGFLGLAAGVSSALATLAGWALASALVHGAATLLGGKGSLRRLLALHGYAHLPRLLQGLLRVVDALTVGEAEMAGRVAFERALGGGLLPLLSGANLGDLWGVWALALLVLAVEENYQVGRLRATLAGALPNLLLLGLHLLLRR